MKGACSIVAIIFLLPLWTGCGGSTEVNNTDALAYIGLSVGKVFNYDIDIGLTLPQAGKLEVIKLDLEYANGIEAYQVEMRQNNNLIATRWFQITSEGLFLLGEGVKEGNDYVERTYLTPIKLVCYPLEQQNGQLVQFWSTQSDIEEGGSENHRFDNNGKATLDLPAGQYETFGLTHTRAIDGGATIALEENFSPENFYVQFEYPKDSIWQLK